MSEINFPVTARLYRPNRAPLPYWAHDQDHLNKLVKDLRATTPVGSYLEIPLGHGAFQCIQLHEESSSKDSAALEDLRYAVTVRSDSGQLPSLTWRGQTLAQCEELVRVRRSRPRDCRPGDYLEAKAADGTVLRWPLHTESGPEDTEAAAPGLLPFTSEPCDLSKIYFPTSVLLVRPDGARERYYAMNPSGLTQLIEMQRNTVPAGSFLEVSLRQHGGTKKIPLEADPIPAVLISDGPSGEAPSPAAVQETAPEPKPQRKGYRLSLWHPNESRIDLPEEPTRLKALEGLVPYVKLSSRTLPTAVELECPENFVRQLQTPELELLRGASARELDAALDLACLAYKTRQRLDQVRRDLARDHSAHVFLAGQLITLLNDQEQLQQLLLQRRQEMPSESLSCSTHASDPEGDPDSQQTVLLGVPTPGLKQLPPEQEAYRWPLHVSTPHGVLVRTGYRAYVYWGPGRRSDAAEFSTYPEACAAARALLGRRDLRQSGDEPQVFISVSYYTNQPPSMTEQELLAQR